MRIPIFCLISLLHLFASWQTYAQLPTASAALDNNLILIGDQIKLYLEAEYDATSYQLNWPVIATDKPLGGLELIDMSAIDTISVGATIKLQQVLTLTGFDEGQLTIPAFEFKYKNTATNRPSNIKTETLPVTVMFPEVDLNQSIKPIKPLLKVPYTWQELLLYTFYTVASLAFLVLLLWLFLKYRRRKNPDEFATIEQAPDIPAHELALGKLKNLKEAQKWQRGEIKAYYSDLSEIIREYIEGRFDFKALESTTDEIMQAFSTVPQQEVPKDLLVQLNQLLSLSDMVKFAKVIPPLEKNDESFQSANRFIFDTKPALNLFEEEEAPTKEQASL